MPIIKRKEKVEKTSVAIRLDVLTAAKLRRYSEYTNVSASEIVTEGIIAAIQSDKKYLATLGNETDCKPAIQRKPKARTEAA